MISYLRVWQAQGLIEEKRRLSCYEFLEQFCVCVASNVSLLQNSSKCPEECREAISSLVYAAARVSEVPELRDLRSLFADRYRTNSLEQFVNPEFVERFKAEPPSKEMKVELLQEIAIEYSIKWDAKSLEQKLYPKTKANYNPGKTNENRSSLSFHVREESLDAKSTSKRSEEDSMTRSKSCVTGHEEEEEDDDPENKPFYYRFIMPSNDKPKIEKQESLPEKMTKSDLMSKDTESPPSAKPRSVRRRLAKPPPSDAPSGEDLMRSYNKMEKASGEGIRRMNRRTASWQSNVPDFDEVAARVHALTRN
ncbi:Regulator of Vps4 activity in the MVB pathway protein [Raphanus sativus]|nr:Regulator of Vps4 activity in the MVB pathway protein [Raphanus sativus]